MSNYLVTDTDLTSVANAIRTKGGTSAQLAFPSGFVSAIGNIPSGGGGASLDSFLAEEITAFRITDSNILSPKTKLSNYPTNSTLFINRCNTAANSMFANSKFTSVVFLPNSSISTGNNFLYGDSVLTICDMGENLNGIGANAFNGAPLTTLILRRSSVVSCSNTSAFSNTPFASGGTGGTIYIPKALYDHLGDNSSSDYKAASNWSTVNGYGTITWAKIEGSYYETHYADGTAIS